MALPKFIRGRTELSTRRPSPNDSQAVQMRTFFVLKERVKFTQSADARIPLCCLACAITLNFGKTRGDHPVSVHVAVKESFPRPL